MDLEKQPTDYSSKKSERIKYVKYGKLSRTERIKIIFASRILRSAVLYQGRQKEE